MRRCLLLAVVVGSQLAAGCYSYRPYLPRLQSGFGCGTGACGTPLLGRPLLDLPIIDRPLLNRPVLNTPIFNSLVAPTYSGAPVGLPVATIPGDSPYYGSGYPVGGYGTPGCVGCGSSGAPPAAYPVGTSGYPLSTLPVGLPNYPYSAVPPGYPGTPGAPAPMPLVMPSALPGGVPHDSALLKMPTIVPPGAPSVSKRPAELARQMSGTK